MSSMEDCIYNSVSTFKRATYAKFTFVRVPAVISFQVVDQSMRRYSYRHGHYRSLATGSRQQTDRCVVCYDVPKVPNAYPIPCVIRFRIFYTVSYRQSVQYSTVAAD
jgi:hypothetical protein